MSGKNPQFTFSCQNNCLELNFFKWDGKLTKIWHLPSYLLFHRIRKTSFLKNKISWNCKGKKRCENDFIQLKSSSIHQNHVINASKCWINLLTSSISFAYKTDLCAESDIKNIKINLENWHLMIARLFLQKQLHFYKKLLLFWAFFKIIRKNSYV